ncbi:MmcQ/YjbR family DNA-binding protein [soil metagenome]
MPLPSFGREQARAACADQTGSEESHPFGDQSAVFKIRGKVFAVVNLDKDPSYLTVKIDPSYAEALVAEYESIRPGYHVNKRHWVTATLDGTVPPRLLRELVEDSCDLVVSKLPMKDRPLSPRGE